MDTGGPAAPPIAEEESAAEEVSEEEMEAEGDDAVVNIGLEVPPAETVESVIAKPEIPKSAVAVPKSAVAVAPTVKFVALRLEPDVDGVFLANKAATTIGSAAARGETDFHITGAERAVGALVTSNPKLIKVAIGAKGSKCFEVSDKTTGATLYIPKRTRINLTTSRIAVAIDGTVVNTMSGQASIGMDAVLKLQLQKCSAVVPVTYSSWLSFGSVVEISRVRFFDERGKEYNAVVLYDEPDVAARCERAATALEAVYNQGLETRKVVVFKLAPPLTKSVMRVPYGVDGSSYDLCASVVNRPPSMERGAFESLVTATLKLETDEVEGGFDGFMADCAQPGLKASTYSMVAANALSTLVSVTCPYRIDGRAVLTPTGLQMTPAESWKAEASRTAFNTSDDCDGSAAHVTAAIADARIVALNPELAAQFPVTARVANAFSMHFVGVCVLAANAGHADDAGKKGAANIAGHAIAMALPRSQVFDSLVTGAYSATQNRDAEASRALVDKMSPLWHAAMFSSDELAAMPKTDVAKINDVDAFMQLHKRAALREMEALAIEGTSPVAPSLLFSRDDKDRILRRRVARDDRAIAGMVGPNVARGITQLDVGPSNMETKHVFYNSMVEFIVSHHEELFRNAALREAGYATAQLVLAQAQQTAVAGATPKDVATSSFSLLPLWTVNTETGADFDVALDEVQRNTLPMRAGPMKLDADSSKIYLENIQALDSLNNQESAASDKGDGVAMSQSIFAIATLTQNRKAVQVFVEKLKALVYERKVAVKVNLVPVTDALIDADGADVGKFVVVNVEKL